MTAIPVRRVPVFWWLGAAMLAAEGAIVHTTAFLQHGALLAYAVFADLALVLPLLYWLLVLRPARKTLLNAAPVFAVGVALAGALLAARSETKGILLVAGGLSEVATVWLLVQRLTVASRQLKGTASDDLLMRLETLSDPLMRVLGVELAAFYYAFVGPRVRRPLAENEFSYSEKSGLGGLLFGLGFVTVVEGLVVHYLLRQWTPKAAWLFTALHGYTLIWLSAAYQAARLRPIALFLDRVLLRTSLLWTAELPLTSLESAVRIKQRPEDKKVLRAYFGDDPNVLLTFTEPQEVRGPLRMRKQVSQIALYVDTPDRFLKHLSSL